MKTTKRFLASLLISCMVISMVPSSAFAQEGIPAPEPAVVENAAATPAESESVPEVAAPVQEAAPTVSEPVQAAETPAAVSAVQEPVQESAPAAAEENAAPAAEDSANTQAETAGETAPAETTDAADPNAIVAEHAAEADAAEDQQTPDETTDPEEEKFELTQYVYDDNVIRVTAYLSNATDLSDRARLIAQPAIPENGYSNASYFEALNEGSDFVYDASNTYLYDIHFELDGVEVQPAGEVTLVAEFKFPVFTDFIHAQNSADVSLIQMPRVGAAAAVYNTTKEAAPYLLKTDIAKIGMAPGSYGVDINAGTMTIKTNSLSVFAMVNSAAQQIVEEPVAEEPAAEEAAAEETEEAAEEEKEFDAVSEEEDTEEKEDEEEEETEVERIERSISASAAGRTVTVSGMLPVDAELSVVAIPLDTAAEIFSTQTGEDVETGEMVFAYDVSILSGGEKYDLEAYGDSVTVSISNIDEEEIAVTHVKIDVTDGNGGLDQSALNEAITEIQEIEGWDITPEGDAVFFDLTSCSVLMGTRGSHDSTVLENADALYFNNGHGPYGSGSKIYFDVEELQPSSTDPVKAGDTVSYDVTYYYTNPENYRNPQTDEPVPYFTNYKETTIVIKLPAGLLYKSGYPDGGWLEETVPNDKDLSVPHTYTIKVGERPASMSPSSFQLDIYVGNNGTANSVNNYDFLSDMITASTSFDIVDENGDVIYVDDNGNIVTGQVDAEGHQIGHPVTYTHFATTTAPDIQTVSPDTWGVTKKANPKTGSVVHNQTDGKDYATFTWDVEVGLLDGQSISTFNNRYSQNGRDWLSSMTLKDVFGTTFSKTGGDVTTPFASFTIEKYLSDTQLTSPVDIQPNADILIWDGETDLSRTTIPDEYKPLMMNYDTLVDNNNNGSPNQLTAKYTKYRVTVKYEVKSEWIAQFPELEGYKLNETNTMYMTAVLAGNGTQPGDATDSQPCPLPYVGVKKLRINKDYRADGATSDVNYNNQHGAISFKISAGENFTVYENTGTAQAPIYTPVAGMSGANSYSGLSKDTDYYLVPGITYTVEEELTADQKNAMKQFTGTFNNYTYVEKPSKEMNEDWNPRFRNLETVGKITVTKWDNAGHKITSKDAPDGVSADWIGFEVYKKNADGTRGEKVKDEAFIGSEGTVTFTKLPYGDYYLHESTPPVGYAGMSEDYAFTISATAVNVTYDAINTPTLSRIKLTKYVGVAEASITNKANQNYPATFQLQRTTGDPQSTSTTWADVGSPVSVGVDGTVSIDADALDSTGNVYWYRFVETIPAGYYDPATGATDYSYSSAVQLIYPEDHTYAGQVRPWSDPATVDMYNRKLVQLRARKYAQKVDKDGKTSQDASTVVTFTLYQYTASNYSDLTPVAGQSPLTAAGNGGYTSYWQGLPLYTNTNTRIHYVVLESDLDNDYVLDQTQTGNIIGPIGGKYFIEIPISTSGNTSIYTDANLPSASKTAYNIQQRIPVQIWKRNYYTNTPIPGAHVTVYNIQKNDDGSYKTDASGNYVKGSIATDLSTSLPINNVEIPLQEGSGTQYWVKVYLKPGEKYLFEETIEPDGMDLYSYSNNGIIDLTSYTQTYANKDTAKNPYVTIYNAPDPLIKIIKVDNSTNEQLSDIVFEIYTKNADGTFSPVLGANNQPLTYQVTYDTSGNPVGVPADLRLTPDVDYYFAERSSTIPAGYLDPNTNFSYYQTHLSGYEYVQGQISGTTTTMTFVKGRVVDMAKDGRKDNTCQFTFKNIPNTGSLKVLKYQDGVLTNGYKIVVSYNDGTQNKTAEATTKTVDGQNGVAVFGGLPVTTSSGAVISYTVTEEMSPAQSKDYYQSRPTTDQVATLSVGELTDKDTSGETLAFYNVSKINIQATKVFRKLWEYGFTNSEELLPDATIGLFKKVGSNWELVVQDGLSNPQKSDANGNVNFGGLERGVDYALIELASPDPAKEPWKENDGFKKLPPQGAATTSIPDTIVVDGVSKNMADVYNVITIPGTVTGDPTKYNVKTFPEGEAKLINANHWVQFDVTKWVDPVAGRVLTPDEFGREEGKPYNPFTYQTSDGKTFTEADNVIFEVFRYVMPEGVDSVTFDLENPSPWESIGRYTTGTLYINDARQIGEFITNADQGITDRYVYMIVEIDVGPNSFNPNPNFKYTFWHEINQNFSATVAESGYIANSMGYNLDKVNYEDVLNFTDPGPGTSLYLLASIRLSKFQDSYKENGDLNQDYQPLPGATFVIKLANGTVLETLTVGLDDKVSDHVHHTPLALAQSGTYGLEINDHDTPNDPSDDTYNLIQYENVEHPVIAENIPIETGTFTDEGGNTYTYYRTPVTVEETAVPDGFSATTGVLNMYLVFVNVTKNNQGESWVFNDAYFVQTIGTGTTERLAADQVDTAWFVTNASSGTNINHITGTGNYPNSYGDTVNPSPLRIVNLPTTNATVRLTKYGYQPTKETVNGEMIGEDLDGVDPASIGRQTLEGVTMVIKKKDGNTYKFWNFNAGKEGAFGTEAEATFTTKEHGLFRFPKGLPEGTYQIYEKSLGDNTNYEMTYPSTRPRTFVVDKAQVNLSMYNPTKLGLEIQKEDMNGHTLKDAKFYLNYGTANPPANIEQTTGTDGKAKFSNLTSRNYWLTEEVAGYSSNYLDMYLQSEYNLTGFTTSPGLAIGYAYTSKPDGKGGTDVAVTKANPSTELLTGPGQLSLTVKNPKTTNIKLTKVKESDTETKLKDATFVVMYRKFDEISGPVSVNIPTLAPGLATANAVRDAFQAVDNKWTRYGTTHTTDDNGEISLTGMYPGVYAFYETTAPAGYDILTDTAGNEVIYSAVVTGGMDVQVTVTPSTATVKNYLGGENPTRTVDTNWVNTAGTTVEVQAANRPKVTLKAQKDLNVGQLDNVGNWSITLNLYDSKTKANKIGTVTITKNNYKDGDNLASFTFKVPGNTNKDAQFSLGTTYYLEEVVNTAPVNTDVGKAQFVINEVLNDGTKVEDIVDGLYLFPVETIDGFTITVKNDWLYGRVDFNKVDEKNKQLLLSGAEFEVFYNKNEGVEGAEEDWVLVPNATVEEILTAQDAGTGSYTATIPLVSAKERTYRIYEKKAPTHAAGTTTEIHYILDPDQFIEVKLSLAENVKTSGLEMTNKVGDDLTIYKFNNVAEAEAHLLDTSQQTKFAVYHKVDGQWVLEDGYEGYTGENGRFTVTTKPGDYYAVAETDWDPATYNKLEGIYTEDDVLLQTETITVGGKDVVLYVLPAAMSGAVVLHAYNVPNVKPIIEKIDVGRYEAGADPAVDKNDVQAAMEYAIYEFDADAIEWKYDADGQPTGASVEEFLATNPQIVFAGSTGPYDDTVLKDGTQGTWDTSTSDTYKEIENRWDYSKSYLIVETKVFADNGDQIYNTMRKDDPDVEWFIKTSSVTVPDPENPPKWTLKNVYGDATVELEKSAYPKTSGGYTPNDVYYEGEGESAVQYVDSLLEAERHVVYHLDPKVTSRNQMLNSFILTDSGIKGFNVNKSNVTSEVTTFDYSFDKIVVGKASHTVDARFGVENEDIKAQIFFTDAAGADISHPDVIVNASSENQIDRTTTDIPEGAKGFRISYFCTELAEKTAETYKQTTYAHSLGENFQAEKTYVYATIAQQEDNAENPVKEVTYFTNYSKVDLDYWKWANDGKSIELASDTMPADHTIKVKPILIPKVSVLKTVDPSVAQAKSTLTYYITITNSENSDTEFKNPIVMDILPTGVTFVKDSERISGVVGIPSADVPTLAKPTVFTGDATVQQVDGQSTISGTGYAVLFQLEGSLPVHSSVTIAYQAYVTESAETFADVQSSGDVSTTILCNDAYLSSAEKAYHTEANPQGRSFTDETGDYGLVLDGPDGAAAKLTGEDSPSALKREGKVKSGIGDYATDQFVWIPDSAQATFTKHASLRLVKAVWGDRDTQGYHDKDMGNCTRTNLASASDFEGWAFWRLSVSNGYNETFNKLQIGDVIPKIGDDSAYSIRDSQYDLNFVGIEKVLMGEDTPVDPSLYTVWYYHGRNDADPNDDTDPVETTLLNALDTREYASQGFTTDLGKPNNITAFIIEFDDSVKLAPGTTLFVTYETKVPDIEDNAEFAKIAYKWDDNHFWYRGNKYSSLISNDVSVTLNDLPVEIQGDLWIDEDQDGVQDTGNHRNYNDYAIIQSLKNAMSFSITDNRNNTVPSTDSGDMSQWDGYNGSDPYDGESSATAKSESIKHFRFENLGAAAVQEQYLNDESAIYADESLLVNRLKGKDPYNYTLYANLNDSTGNLSKFFKPSPLGSGYYITDEPAATGFDTSANYLDNNFYNPNTISVSGVKTKPFFVRSSETVDQSKDYGVMSFRPVEITKVAADDEEVKIEGAKFSVYGPYEDRTLGYNPNTPAYGYDTENGGLLKFKKSTEGEGDAAHTVYTPDPEGTETVLETDENGKIYIKDLNWWKEYVFEEVEAAPGYDKDGVKAYADEAVGTKIIENEDGTFTLLVPSNTKTENDGADKVTVKNPRSVEVQLDVEKILKMYSAEDMTFEFKYWLTSTDPEALEDLNADIKNSDADNPLETIEVTVSGNHTNGVRTAIGSFEPITLYGAGTYVFSIQENAGSNPNVQYDTAVKTAKVVVAWDNTAKKLVVSSIEYTDPETVTVDGVEKTYETFTNEYTSKPVKKTPSATKSISGEEVSYDVTFNFKLTAESVETDGAYVSYDPDAAQNTAIKKGDTQSKDLTVVKGHRAEIVDFDGITYTLPGTYVYTITESADSQDPHFTYSNVTWTYTVEVGYGTDGNLEVKSEKYTPSDVVDNYDENDTTAVFVNTYTPTPVDWIPQVKKLMSGEPIPEAKQFTFKLTADAKNPEGAALPITKEVTVTVPKEATESPIGQFADEDTTVDPAVTKGIEFTKAGTYTFQIEEISGSDTHIAYSTAKATLTVTVEDVDGQLTVTSVDADGDVDIDGIVATATFTNTYTVEPTKYQPQVIKRIVGEETTEAITFNFALSADETNPAGASLTSNDDPEIISITIPKGKTGVDYYGKFSYIDFTKAGTYKFTVSEVQPAAGQEIDGITYDERVYTLTVEVTDTNGVLTATASYDPADALKPGYAVFENSYAVKPTEYIPPLEKIVTVDYGPLKADKKFNFKLTADASNPEGASLKPSDDPDTKELTVPAGATTASGSFNKITFTKAGTYVFKAAEVIPADADKYEGITYSTEEYTLTVEIEDAGSQLRVKSAVFSGGTSTIRAAFTNPYRPTPTTYVPKVSKALTQSFGKTTEDKTFNFTMQAYADNPADGAEIRVQETLSDGTKLDKTSVVIPAGDTAEKEAAFGAVTFNKEGTYRFLIKEVNDGNQGITYDPAEWTLTVVVVDNDGKLAISTNPEPAYTSGTKSDKEKAPFVNSYKPTPTKLTLPVKKTLKGNNPPEDVTFDFALSLTSQTDADNQPINGGSSPESGTAQVTMTTAGTTKTVDFSEITYTKAGTYVYTVKETAGTVSGMKYDNAEYTVKVTVTDNNGALAATYSIKKGENAAEELLFENEYNPKPVKAPLKAKKLLDGEPLFDPANTVFTFTMSSMDGVDATGFEMPAETQIQITGTELESAPGRTLTKAFDDISFKKPGTYKFQIIEEAGANSKIYYDPTNWVVTVVVRDAKNGNLVIDPDGITYTPRTSDGAHSVNNEAAVFTNNYNPDDTQFTPKVEKIMNGEPIVKDKYFHFTLKADPANPEGASFKSTDAPMTAEIHVSPNNGSGGTESFNMITFSKAGSYTFIAEEVVESETGITYTREKGTMTLTVENQNDAMKITNVTKTGDVDVTMPTQENPEVLVKAKFTNTYMPTPVSWKLFAKKYMSEDSEPTVVDKDFTFELAATKVVKDGVYLSKDPYKTAIENNDTWSKTVTVPAGSTFSPVKAFDEFTFIRSGEYVFTINEVIPENDPLPGITYTTEPVIVTVTVEDINEELNIVDIKVDGTAEFDEDDDLFVNAIFTNEYDVEPVFLPLPVFKDLTVDFGPTVEDKVFNFTLDLKSAKNGERDVTDGCTHWSQPEEAKRRVTNPPYAPFKHDDAQVTVEAGKVKEVTTFDEIWFTKAGTYVFEIKETAEDLAGITYDTKVWTLTVVVTDTDNYLEETHTYSFVDEDGNTVMAEDIIDEDGNLVERAHVTFNNEYKPEPVDWTPKAQKLMAGTEDIVKDKTFSFNLDLISQKDAAGENMTGGTTWAATDTKTVTVHAGEKKSDVVPFENMTFSKAGTYVFKITETANTNDDQPAMSYADAIELTVEILDTDGKLKVNKVTANPADKVVRDETDNTVVTAQFTNTYNPYLWAPKVLKKLTGRDWLPHEGFDQMKDSFTFTLTPNESSLTDKDGNKILSPMPVDKGSDVKSVTVTIDKESNFEADFAKEYGKIFFEKVGTYSYTVTEVIPEGADENGVYNGITYAKPVTITFELIEKDGKLVPAGEEDDPATEDIIEGVVETVEFENIYEAKGEIDFPASKHFANGNMATETYNFEVYEAKEVPATEEGGVSTWVIPEGAAKIAEGKNDQTAGDNNDVIFQYRNAEGTYNLPTLVFTQDDLIEKPEESLTGLETPDAGTPDAGTPDAGTPDAGTPDAGTPGTGTTDPETPGTGTTDPDATETGEPGAATENKVTYLDSKVFDYLIVEVVPEDATAIFEEADGLKRVAYKDATDEQKETGRFVKNNVVYDGSKKHVQVLVADNKKNGVLDVTIVEDKSDSTIFENTWDKARLRLTKTITEYVEGENVNAVFNFLITGDGTWTDGTPFEPVSKSVKYNAASNNAQYVDIELPYDLRNVKVTEVYSGNYEADGGPDKTLPEEQGKLVPAYWDGNVPVYTVSYTNYLKKHDHTKGIVNVYSNADHPDVTEEGTGFVITERIGAED